MSSKVVCPHCNKQVVVEDALRHQIEESIKAEAEKTLEKKVEKAKNEALEKYAKESKEENERTLQDLKDQLAEKDKKVEQFREDELKLLKEKRKLEEANKDIELSVARKVDEERKKIEEDASKRASEEYRLKEKENEKVIGDLKKALEEARRKAHQGSQQLQGEVLELDFEDTLKEEFTNDTIEPVEKGVKGADVRQIVKSPKGVVCGVILWENKRTKAWSDSWISKLKDDLRAEKANIPVIVSTVLPKEIQNGMGVKDGVWITNPQLAVMLATLLRKNLLDVGYQKAVDAHRGNKAEQLYAYITSHEFKQEIEAILETYNETKTQVTKERAAFERQWKLREKQAEKLLTTTARLVGGIQGEVGQAALPVKGLDLLEADSES